MSTKIDMASATIRAGGKLMSLKDIDARDLVPALSAQQIETIAESFPAHQAAQGTAFDASRTSIVANAVANDPECKGKADVALTFLADENLQSINGEGLVRLIKSAGSAYGAASEEARDAEQRAFMKELLARNENSKIVAGWSSGEGETAAAGARGWQKATAEANARYGL